MTEQKKIALTLFIVTSIIYLVIKNSDVIKDPYKKSKALLYTFIVWGILIIYGIFIA